MTMNKQEMTATIYSLNGEIEQLRKEMHDVQQVVGMLSKRFLEGKKKTVPLEAERLLELMNNMLEEHCNHPLVDGVDVFRGHDLHLLMNNLTTATDELILDKCNAKDKTNAKTRHEAGKMTKLLKHAGVKTDVGQQYQRATNGFGTSRKPIRYFVIKNHDKYLDMSKAEVARVAQEQNRQAYTRYSEELKKRKPKLDTEVSFL